MPTIPCAAFIAMTQNVPPEKGAEILNKWLEMGFSIETACKQGF